MHEVVFSYLRSKLLEGRRRPSFAGNGLPERMRSTAFAFLGLTAAAGLALVAIFAQVGLPVLSPAPAPSGPSQGNSVAEAVALSRDREVRAPRLAGGVVPSGVRGAARAGGRGASAGQGEDGVGAVGSPLAVATPPAGGGVDGGSTEAPPPAPTPSAPPAPSEAATTTTAPAPAPEPESTADPKPNEKPAKPKPAKTTATSKPAKPKPSKSEGKAPKAEAKPPKTEAKTESKANKTEAAQEAKPPKVEADPEPPSKSSPPPPPEAPAEKSNGKALGRYK